MHEDFVDAIQKAMRELSIAFFPTEPQAGPVKIKPSDTPYVPQTASVTAHVAYSGGVNGGMFLFCSTRDVALQLAAVLSGETPAAFDATAKDALGELTNMMAGNVQTRLEEVLGSIGLTPPQVFAEGAVAQSCDPASESVRLIYRYEGGFFMVEVYFKTPE
ncbi:MAG: chemotaxis protein CheX [Magnetococcales bacterium]|nr:chemotaxis protein CheX [Magnetococcales bacterium]